MAKNKYTDISFISSNDVDYQEMVKIQHKNNKEKVRKYAYDLFE